MQHKTLCVCEVHTPKPDVRIYDTFSLTDEINLLTVSSTRCEAREAVTSMNLYSLTAARDYCFIGLSNEEIHLETLKAALDKQNCDFIF